MRPDVAIKAETVQWLDQTERDVLGKAVADLTMWLGRANHAPLTVGPVERAIGRKSADRLEAIVALLGSRYKCSPGDILDETILDQADDLFH
jgi:hypothetical protein